MSESTIYRRMVSYIWIKKKGEEDLDREIEIMIKYFSLALEFRNGDLVISQNRHNGFSVKKKA